MVSVITLPDDVLLRVFTFLDISDILTLRMTCSSLYRVTTLRHAWLQALMRISQSQARERALRRRFKPLVELSSSQLEILARHNTSIQDSFHSGSKPAIAVKLDRKRCVTWVQILEGRWMLTAASDSSVSELSLWSISSLLSGSSTNLHTPLLTAYLTGPVAQGLVEVRGERIVIALEIRCPTHFTDIVSVSTHNDAPVLVRLAQLPGVSRIRCLRGTTLGYALDHEVSIPCVQNWETGVVTRLLDHPDLLGGCVAMDVQGGLLALVTPRHLEVYDRGVRSSREAICYRRICQIELPRPPMDTCLAFTSVADKSSLDGEEGSLTLCTLRLCMAGDYGLFVYDFVISSNEGDSVVHETWAQPSDERHDRYRPCFGKHPESVSWYSAVPRTPWTYVAFATAMIPLAPVPPSVNPESEERVVYQVLDPDMPALHCAGVCDYDESLGVLVAGSGYGELTIYGLCKTDPELLESCLNRAHPPSLGDEEELPTVPVPSVAVPPYPISLFAPMYRIDPKIEAVLIARWAAEQIPDDEVPEGWTTDFLHPEHGTIPWWLYVLRAHDGIPWEMERQAHYFGTPVLLLYCQSDCIAIFSMGGLLFVNFEEAETVCAADHGVSATELALAIDTGIEGPLLPHRIFRCVPSSKESHRYFILWQREKHKLGRDRWAEFKDRGGEVDPGWLRTNQLVFVGDLE